MYRGMFKKQKVFSLSDCALMTFGNSLVKSLESINCAQNEEEIVVQIKGYMESTVGKTSGINEQLLRLIYISDIKFPARLLCLQILMNEGVRHFEDSIVCDASDNRFWSILANQCGGLQMLDLENSLLTEDHIDHFTKILQKSPNLVELQLPYICTRKMLEIVAENCTKLRFLKMTDYYDMNYAVEFLTSSPFAATLTKVELNLMEDTFETNICENVAIILRNCPKVEIITPFCIMSEPLRICQEKDENFKCNLKCFRDDNTTVKKAKVIVETCPKLEEIALVVPDSGVLEILSSSSIQRLILNKFISAELIGLLEKIGHQLRFLSINDSDANVDVADIARLCPSLVVLDFLEMRRLVVGKGNFSFPRLEKIEFCDSPLSDLDLKKVMCSTQSLRTVKIDDLRMNDDFLEEIFSSHNFDKLEVFFAHDAPQLTVRSIKMLIRLCPKIQRMGKFYRWNVTQADIDSIKCLQKSGRHNYVLNSTVTLPKSVSSMAITLQDYLTITKDIYA